MSTGIDVELVEVVAADDDKLAAPVVVAAVDVSLATASVEEDIELARFVLVNATTAAARVESEPESECHPAAPVVEVAVVMALVVAAADVVSRTVLVDDGPVAAATLYRVLQHDANGSRRTHLVLAEVVDATDVVETASVEALAVVVATVVDASMLG